MCGFFGVIQRNTEFRIPIKEISSLMFRRGPDDWGWLSLNNGKILRSKKDVQIDGSVIFAHQRLSIIDLSDAGWQPMVSECERYSITYNGEIYNYLELKEELLRLGHKFNTHSDTEVIIVAWKEWGHNAVKRFKGMFAFSLIDKDANRVYIARDFFGIKPAYYCKWENGWGFGSTINSLKALQGVSFDKNPQRVYEYLRFGMTDRGVNTLYKDIKQVLPGTIIEIDICTLEIVQEHRFWKLKPVIDTKISFNEAVEKTREFFLESIKLHMRSDVPVGAALSGGIDSSSIVCSMRHLYPEKEIHTFTFVSENSERSEEKWADIVVDHANVIAHKIKPTSIDLANEIDELSSAQEEPYSSTSIFAQFKVYEAAKEAGIKVMLDGQGADEMLGGYLYYQGARLATLIRSGNIFAIWSFLNQSKVLDNRSVWLLFKMTGPYLIPETLIPMFRRMIGKSISPHWIDQNWMTENKIKSRSGAISKMAKLGYLTSHLVDSTKQIANLLRYADRNSMYHSVESRVPFLLPGFAEFLLSLPEEYLISDQGVTKYVFREAMRGLVPDAILNRHDKIGFEVSQNRWLSQLKNWTSESLNTSHNNGIIDIKFIQKEMENLNLYQAESDSQHIWRTVCILNCFKNDYAVSEIQLKNNQPNYVELNNV